MNQRNLLLGGVVAIAFAAIMAWWLRNHERVAREVEGPLRGEARYNPLYGLERALAAHGMAVDSQATLDLATAALGPGELLVLGSDVRTLGAGQVDGLLEWVAAGGHLVFGLPAGAEGRRGELLERFALTVSREYQCTSWRRRATRDELDTYCVGFSFRVGAGSDREFDVLLGSAGNGYVLGRKALGVGDWTVAGDLGFLTNRELDDDGRAALAWQVLAPGLTAGRALLIYAVDVPPLHVLLLRHGWPVVLPLALALLAWLWMRSARLGPLLPPAATDRRALAEHVHAAGAFAFRRGRANALHAAMRRALIAHWLRREPALAALEGDALVRELAARGRRDPEAVRRALYPPDLVRPERFLAAIRTLMELKPRP